MSTQRMLVRFYTNTTCIIFFMLGSLLVSLQLVLPTTAFAASPRATSTYTFGNSRPMDLASVAVVRLVVSTSPTPSVRTPKPCGSGVGTIVSSNAQQGTALNYVLTDSSLLICGPSSVAATVTIDANDAYTNNGGVVTLAQINCVSNLATCTTNTFAQPASKTICQNGACNVAAGAMLLPFVTASPQPYLTTTLTPLTPEFHITLGNPSATILPQTATTLQNLLPIAPDQQAIDNTSAATPTANKPFYEAGTPLVDNNGNLVSIHTGTGAGAGDSIIASATIPPSTTNPLQSNWQADVTDFYKAKTKADYAAVSGNAVLIGAINPNFRAATGLKAAADLKLTPTATPHSNHSTTPSVPQSTNGFFGIPYAVLAIAGLILLILLVALVSLIVGGRHLIVGGRHRRELARFEREQEAKRQKHRKPVTLPQQQQPITLSLPNQVSPAKNTIAVDSVSHRTPEIHCQNCHHMVTADASFCPNCRFQLKSVEQKQDNGLSVQERAKVNEPPKVVEVPLQEVVPSNEKENGRVGQQFGNYKLLRSLGEGGFAEVYLGEHIHLGSYAAIKILSGRLTGKEQEKFRLEARTLVRLLHPHIVRLLDFGIEDKVPFLVMDYAVNGTLRQRHPKGSRVPLPLVVNYVKQAADALQFAHDQKLIHRDIKPENMLLGSRNEVLLSDFGIAVAAQSSRYQNPQDMAGTVSYMAPEQIQLHPRPASDQYALGVVTYEWLCGSRPFQGSFTEIAVKHATVLPPPLRRKVSTISLPVEQVVLKSLAKDPKERFESVEKFAIALELASLL